MEATEVKESITRNPASTILPFQEQKDESLPALGLDSVSIVSVVNLVNNNVSELKCFPENPEASNEDTLDSAVLVTLDELDQMSSVSELNSLQPVNCVQSQSSVIGLNGDGLQAREMPKGYGDNQQEGQDAVNNQPISSRDSVSRDETISSESKQSDPVFKLVQTLHNDSEDEMQEDFNLVIDEHDVVDDTCSEVTATSKGNDPEIKTSSVGYEMNCDTHCEKNIENELAVREPNIIGDVNAKEGSDNASDVPVVKDGSLVTLGDEETCSLLSPKQQLSRHVDEDKVVVASVDAPLGNQGDIELGGQQIVIGKVDMVPKTDKVKVAPIDSPLSPDHHPVFDDPIPVREIPVDFNESVLPLSNSLDRSSPASPVDGTVHSLEIPVLIPDERPNSTVAYFPNFEKRGISPPDLNTSSQVEMLVAADHPYSVNERLFKCDTDVRRIDTDVRRIDPVELKEAKRTDILPKPEIKHNDKGDTQISFEPSRRDLRMKKYLKNRRLSEPETGIKKLVESEGKMRERSLSGTARVCPARQCDAYCWTCHAAANVISCRSCLRSYHSKCLPSDWKQTDLNHCPECSGEVEDLVSKYSADSVYTGFCFLISRVGSVMGYDLLTKTLEAASRKNSNIIPVTFRTIEERIEDRYYANTKSLYSDFQWVYHNLNILDLKNELKLAKLILKTTKQEIVEIETCLECYLRANTLQLDWFVEPCRRPHLLVWARLKGYPYWPAKAMRHSDERVDVRFFGAHDRSWVPAKDVFLYSRDIPQPPMKNKRSQNLEECIDEIETHIVKLKKRFGGFNYHPNKAKYVASRWDEYLQTMLPNYKVTPTKRRRTSSSEAVSSPVDKKRKSSEEEPSPSPPPKLISTALAPVVAQPEVANPSPVPTTSPAVSGGDVTSSPDTQGAPANPPLKIKVKLNSGKRGFATITPDQSPAREEAKVEKVKKRRRRADAMEKKTDTEESESESKRLEADSVPSTPQTPSLCDVPPFFSVPPSPVSATTEPVVASATEPEEVGKMPPQESAPVIDDEIQKLMNGRKSLSLVPKSGKSPIPSRPLEEPVKKKRTARKSFPIAPKPVVEETVPENITIKAEPSEYVETPPASLVEEAPIVHIAPVPPKTKAAVPALRAIRPSVTAAVVTPPPASPASLQPIAPRVHNTQIRGLMVRPGLSLRVVNPPSPTVRAPVIPILPAANSPVTDPVNNGIDPLAMREIAKREAERITATLQGSMEAMLTDLAAQGNPYAQMAKMKVEIHNLKKSFQEQLDAARKSADTKLNDVKNKLLAEKERALASSRVAMQLEKKKAVEETKKKQWCAQCGTEAFMYCCWNTSYCTYRCQQTHWPDHLKTCASTAKDKSPAVSIPVSGANTNPMSLIVATQGMTQNSFQSTVSVPHQPITVAFGGAMASSNPQQNLGGQKILLLSNGSAANGQFFLRGPTSLTVRPVMGNNGK